MAMYFKKSIKRLNDKKVFIVTIKLFNKTIEEFEIESNIEDECIKTLATYDYILKQFKNATYKKEENYMIRVEKLDNELSEDLLVGYTLIDDLYEIDLEDIDE